ncbi:MAG: DUF4870 domain-containing protein [Thermoanaerobaculia bacterium]|nr:DUF4870 domain-containing protein [Thermoanaerobaculia bacterium]MCZ7652574.1 DUF4870 domain-containing protein [Thermoanaerobaculia bacterium]
MSDPMATPPPPPPPAAPAPGDNRTLMLVLAYLGLLALVPLLVEKNDTEVQWHAKNGLVLTIAFIVLFVVLSILGAVPAVGCLTVFLWPVAGLGWLILSILGIVKATKGERFVIPGLSDFVAKF